MTLNLYICIFQVIIEPSPLVSILVYTKLYINNCSDMSIGDTFVSFIVIEHPQLQAIIITCILKQVHYFYTHLNYEHLRTYRYRTNYRIIELDLVQSL
jgi:hypothetical protein